MILLSQNKENKMSKFNYDDLIIENIEIETILLADLMDSKGKWKYDASSEQFGMSVDMQYSKLLLSVKSKGQTRAVYIWRNRIMDGRNRCKALLEAGIDTVKIRRFPNQMDSKQRRQVAKDEEMARRHETPTQIACTAIKEYFRLKDAGTKVTQEEVLLEYPTSTASMILAVWLYKNQNSVFVNLFDGKPYPIPLFDSSGDPLLGERGKQKFDTTDSLNKIVAYFKKKKKDDERIRLAQEAADMEGDINEVDLSEFGIAEEGGSSDHSKNLALLFQLAESYIHFHSAQYDIEDIAFTMKTKMVEAVKAKESNEKDEK